MDFYFVVVVENHAPYTSTSNKMEAFDSKAVIIQQHHCFEYYIEAHWRNSAAILCCTRLFFFLLFFENIMKMFRLIAMNFFFLLSCVPMFMSRLYQFFESSTNQMEKREEKNDMKWSDDREYGDKMTESNNCAMNTNLYRFAISLALKVSHLHEFQRQYTRITTSRSHINTLSHLFASLIKFSSSSSSSSSSHQKKYKKNL